MAERPRRGRPPSPETAHRQAAAWLRTQLTSKRWKVGEVLPSLRQLARESPFSFGAMRQAVEQVKGERRVHVSANKRLVVTRLIDSPMDGRDMLLVVSSNPIGDRSLSMLDMLRGILRGAGELHVPVTIAHAHGFEFAVAEGFLNLPLKGILLLDHYSPEILRAYEALDVPVVLADHVPFGRKLGAVSADNRAGAREATQRLLAAGHRRIGFVRRVLYHLGDIDPDSKERLEGYKSALLDAGLEPRKDAIFNFLPEKANPTYPLRGLFSLKPEITAVICADASVADLVARAAQQMGKSIPSDVGLVCFQDLRQPSVYSGPAIDFETIGLEAARMLARWKTPAPQLRIACSWRERTSFLPRGKG